MIIMCRRLRDGNPCLKDQLEDRKHVGKMTFGRYKEHEYTQLGRKWHRIEIVGRKRLRKPEPYIGCSAL
jgi:hypothetical protein